MPAISHHQRSIFLLAILLLLAMVSWVGFGIEILSTQAYFSDSGSAGGVTFAAGYYDPLFMSAGTSKDTHVNQVGPFHTIAQVLNGQFYLDFGEIAVGNGNNSPDVFRIKNTDAVPLNMTFELSPGIAPYFEYVRLKDGGSTIAAGQIRSVEMKLVTKADMPVGIYSGQLRIKAGPGKIDKVVPVYFVVCKQPPPKTKLAGPPVASPAEPMGSTDTNQSLSAEPLVPEIKNQAPSSISPNPGAPTSDPAPGAPDPLNISAAAPPEPVATVTVSPGG